MDATRIERMGAGEETGEEATIIRWSPERAEAEARASLIEETAIPDAVVERAMARAAKSRRGSDTAWVFAALVSDLV